MQGKQISKLGDYLKMLKFRYSNDYFFLFIIEFEYFFLGLNLFVI